MGSINVTKSTVKCPMTPRSLHAKAIFSVAVHSWAGSTDACGTEYPQHMKGEAEWI